MSDDLSYPSPLMKKTKYVGELCKRREFVELPKPAIPSFIIGNTASSNYDVERELWAEKQVEQDIQGFFLLAGHYNLDIESEHFYEQLALFLARDHVACFKMKNKNRKNSDKTEIDFAVIAVEVYLMAKSEKRTLPEAKNEYAKKHNKATIKNAFPVGVRLINQQNGENFLETRTLEQLLDMKDILEEDKKQLDQENDRWYDQ